MTQKKAPTSKPPAEGREDVVRSLAKLLDETGLGEIEVEQAGLRVRVSRATIPGAATIDPSVETARAVPTASAAPDVAQHPGVVKSPMVGIAYSAPKPGAKPFVEIGSSVKSGDTLLIIETMKMMNDIRAQHSGTVTQILFENAHPVEFDEPLMIIERNGT